MLTILINATVAIAAMNGMNVPDITFPGSFQAARSDEISASVWYTSLFTSVRTLFVPNFKETYVYLDCMRSIGCVCTLSNA